LSALTGRFIFYGLLTVTLTVIFGLSFNLWSRLRRRDGTPRIAGRGALCAAAAVAVWVNLALLSLYVIYEKISVPLDKWVFYVVGGVFVPAAIVSLMVISAVWLTKRFRPVRVILSYASTIVLVAGAVGAASVVFYQNYVLWARPPPPHLPDVILITLDAWRADALRGDISPGIVAYARNNGIVFTNAQAPSSWTLPSFAAIFTGSYNVTDRNGLERRDDVRTTWAEVMRDSGYDTFAVVHNPYLDTIRLLSRGFVHFDYVRFNRFLAAIHFYDTAWYFAKRVQRFAPETPGEANRKLTEKTLYLVRASSQKPKFIWVHYLDPHYPYQPTAEVLREKAPHLTGKTDLGTDKGALSRGNADAIKTLYECEVESTDREVTRLLAELAPRPNTLVVISSDHGEEFFEHGRTGHGKTLYEEVCKVPLVIVLPHADPERRGPSETSVPVSLIDVAPSILNYLDLAVPSKMEGRDDILKIEISTGREVFASLNFKKYLVAALTIDGKKVVITNKGDDVRTEYFDLNTDPGERTPLPLDEDGKLLRQKLQTWLNEQNVVREEGPGVPSPFGERADLRALGYM